MTGRPPLLRKSCSLESLFKSEIMKKIITLLFLTVQIGVSIAQSCNQLDQGFGVNGRAIGLSLNNQWMSGGNILVQPDNKIIQVGAINSEFIAVRYTAGGQPDNTFGLNGTATLHTGGYNYSFGPFGALQDDGKIVMVGTVYTNNSYYRDIVLVRFNRDGTPDNTFGSGGKVMTAISSYNEEGNGIAIQPDGKIVVAASTPGTCFSDCAGYQFCMPAFTVLRFTSNGALDTEFGQSGKSVIPGNSISGGRAVRIAIQPDGKITAVGETLDYYCDDYYGGQYSSSGILIARFDAQGKIDGSFGVNGMVKDAGAISYVAGTALQPDGKIIITGTSNQGGNVTKRYHNDGKPDNSFISGGLSGYVNAMTLDKGGKIILGGVIYKNNLPSLLVIRLNNNGSPDSSFSGDGAWQSDVDPQESLGPVTGVAIQQDRIIAGSSAQYYNFNTGSTRYDQFVTRLKDSLDDILVSVDRSGPLYPCDGQSVILSVSQPGSLQWYRDGQLIIGATDSVFNATIQGIYWVKVTHAGKCGESADIRIFFNSLPVSIIPDGGLKICFGDSVKLVSSERGTLQWFKDGFAINGATDTAYVARTQGYYSVGVKNSQGCGQSGTVYVEMDPVQPSITWDGIRFWTNSGYYAYQWYKNGQAISGANGENYEPIDVGVYNVVIGDYGCNNSSITFDLNCGTVSVPQPVISWDGANLVASPGFSVYQWYLNGNAITGEDTSFLQPVEFGTYRVVGTGGAGCSNSSGDFAYSCDVAGPSKPLVDFNGSQFTTFSGYPHYQWYYNDTVIAGATSNTYTPGATQFGNYKVVITNNLNCSTSSDPKPYWITASNDLMLEDASLRYYPNPVRTTLFIDVSMLPNKKMTAMLYDLSGKKLKQQELRHGPNQIQLEQFNSGLYQLAVQYGFERKVLKVVVLK